jgi:hypothetical protein
MGFTLSLVSYGGNGGADLLPFLYRQYLNKSAPFFRPLFSMLRLESADFGFNEDGLLALRMLSLEDLTYPIPTIALPVEQARL